MQGQIIFLDIDGVMHDLMNREFDFFEEEPVRCLNTILSEFPQAKLVVSSSWRHLVHGGNMTLWGFEYLLRTHGIACGGRLEGITVDDEIFPTRGAQIRQYLRKHGNGRPYVVLDDINDQIVESGLHFVQTDSREGLSFRDVEAVLDILDSQLLQHKKDG